MEQNKRHKFWQSKAKMKDINCVGISDTNLNEIENKAITKYLEKEDKLLDVGCGAGYTTLTFSKYVSSVIGIDFSENMIKRAKDYTKSKTNNIEFLHKSILDMDFKDNFNKAISVRCLINLTSWKNQKKAILNIHKALEKGGLFILCESTYQGLENINKMRRKVGLKDCPIVKYNLLFDKHKLIDFIEKYFSVVKVYDFGLYYFISRIIHPLLVYPKEPKWDHKINRIAKDLAIKSDMFSEMEYESDIIHEMSYESIFILKKK